MPNQTQMILKKPQIIKENILIFYGMNVNWEGYSLPALMIDKEDLILIGVPSAQDFFKLITAVGSIAPVDKIKYIVALEISSQFSAVMSLFANASLYPTIITSKMNTVFLDVKNFKQQIVYIEDIQMKLSLPSGVQLEFISSPFIRHPGAFIVYDQLNKILYSSYLFETKGRYLESINDSKWLGDALQMIKTVVPSIDFLKPVIEKIKKLKIEAGITISNKVIFKSRMDAILLELSKLEFSNAVYQSVNYVSSKYIQYSESINRLIPVLINAFGQRVVSTTFDGSVIRLDENNNVIKPSDLTELELWNDFFDVIYARNGMPWLVVLESHVRAMVKDLNHVLPNLYQSSMMEAEQKTSQITLEKVQLESKISALEIQLERTVDRLMKDPLTHVYNEIFLKEYLKDEIASRTKGGFIANDITLIYINIDNILRLNAKYSKEIGDETIQNLGYLLNQIKKEGDIIFKRSAPGFIYYANKQDELAIVIAQRIQNAIRESEVFVEKITASLSIVKLSEFSPTDPISSIVQSMMSLGENRIKIGAIKGTNVIIDSQTKVDRPINGKILIVDDEQINLSLLKSMFFNLNYEIVTAVDGSLALELIKSQTFDVIIAERNIPKIDGLSLKLAVNDITINAKALYVLLTYNKNKETVLRANQFGVDYVLQKPILFDELLGFIQRSIKQRRAQG